MNAKSIKGIIKAKLVLHNYCKVTEYRCQHGPEHAAPQILDGFIFGRPFLAPVIAEVLAMPVSVLIAIGFVMLLVITDQII